jgi:hypothetical protein
MFFLTYKTTAHFPHSYNVAHFPSEKKENYIKQTPLLESLISDDETFDMKLGMLISNCKYFVMLGKDSAC